MKKVLLGFLVAVLTLLVACQSGMDLEVKEEREGLIYYEYAPVEKVAEEVPFDVPVPTEFPFEAGETCAQVYQSTKDEDRLWVTMRFVRESEDIDFCSEVSTPDVYELVDYTVTNYKENYDRIDESDDFEKRTFGDQEVYVNYSKELPAAQIVWSKNDTQYSINYINAYAREETPTKEQFIEDARAVFESIER